MTDVARRARVSQSTVSYAISGSRAISDEVRERVLAAVDELGYRPNTSARALRGASTGIIGVSIPAFPAFRTGIAQFHHELGIAARDAGFNLLLIADENATDGLERVLSSGLADGVIVASITVDDPRPALLAEYDMPYVAFGATGVDAINSVDVDFATAARTAVRVLFERGATTIAFMPGSQEEAAARHAYVATSTAAAEAEAAALGIALTVLNPFRTRTALRRDVRSAVGVDAFVSLDLENVADLLSVVTEERPGLRLGRSVVTIGPRAPQLDLLTHTTHVTLPMGQAARQAVDLLVAWIRNGHSAFPGPRPVLLPPTYVSD